MSVHDSIGYSIFRINFGRSPSLPVDVMLGRVPPSDEAEKKEVPEYMEEVCRSLKIVYSDVRQKLTESHKRNKTRHDRRTTGKIQHVGDRVRLYVPAIKQGRTKTFASLWRGPHTILDRVDPVNY